MMDKHFLMNILIEFIKDTIVSNDNIIDKDYIYQMIINPNYSTDKVLEDINDNESIFDNWLRFFKYEKDIIVQNENEYFSLKSNDYDKKYLPGSIKLYIPINKERIEIAVKKIFDYIRKESIKHSSKVFPKVRNDNIVIRVFDMDNVNKIIKFVNTNEYIKSGMMDLSPFVTEEQGVGLVIDFNIPYHDILSQKLYEYFLHLNKNNNLDSASVDNFKLYLENKLSEEKDKEIKLVTEIIIENLSGNSNIDTIIKYNNEIKLRIINLLIFNIYNIYDYKKTIDIISKYDSIIKCNIKNNVMEMFKLFIDEGTYYKLLNNNYSEKLNKIIYDNTGFTKEQLDELYITKKERLYKTIIKTFNKSNCYQEIKLYLKEYLNNEEFDCSNTWINNIDSDISLNDIKYIIKKELKTVDFNDKNVELFINKVLISEFIDVSYDKKNILKDSIINTYENRNINRKSFIRDAIKQYILIDKINGFTNDNDSRNNVINNISPYECFYIIANKNEKTLTLDTMITNYIHEIMPYISGKTYNIDEQAKFLEDITKDLLNSNNLTYVVESLKLCLLGSMDGLKYNSRLIIEKCIGNKNIINIIKSVFNKTNQEILEEDEAILVSSYVNYINSKYNTNEVLA